VPYCRRTRRPHPHLHYVCVTILSPFSLSLSLSLSLSRPIPLSFSPSFNRHLRVTVVDPAADERFLEKPIRSRLMRRDATCRTFIWSRHTSIDCPYFLSSLSLSLFLSLSPFSSLPFSLFGWLLSAHARYLPIYVDVFNYALRRAAFK